MKTKRTHFVVKTSSASMPASCWGNYARVAILEVEDGLYGDDIKMISSRARGVVRVVATWEKLNVGKTERCAYDRAWVEATEIAEKLNEASELLRKFHVR
jgi:hypothetical protein